MKLEDSMSTKTRRKYTEEFKAEAVRWVRDSVQPVAQVARDLGIADCQRSPAISLADRAATGVEPGPHTPVDACGTGGARATETRKRDLEAEARFLTMCDAERSNPAHLRCISKCSIIGSGATRPLVIDLRLNLRSGRLSHNLVSTKSGEDHCETPVFMWMSCMGNPSQSCLMKARIFNHAVYLRPNWSCIKSHLLNYQAPRRGR